MSGAIACFVVCTYLLAPLSSGRTKPSLPAIHGVHHHARHRLHRYFYRTHGFTPSPTNFPRPYRHGCQLPQPQHARPVRQENAFPYTDAAVHTSVRTAAAPPWKPTSHNLPAVCSTLPIKTSQLARPILSQPQILPSPTHTLPTPTNHTLQNRVVSNRIPWTNATLSRCTSATRYHDPVRDTLVIQDMHL